MKVVGGTPAAAFPDELTGRGRSHQRCALAHLKQVAEPEPGRTPLRCEIVCRHSGRHRYVPRTCPAFALPIARALRPGEQAWLEGCTGRTSHYALTVMHVHRLRVSLSRTLRILSASESFSQPRNIGKAVGIDADGGHGRSSRGPEPAWRRGQTGVRVSVAGASHPAAPCGRPADGSAGPRRRAGKGSGPL